MNKSGEFMLLRRFIFMVLLLVSFGALALQQIDYSMIAPTPAQDSAVVHNSGNESISGTKTFSASPVFSSGATFNGSTAFSSQPAFPAQSMVRLNTGNGHGSTNTMIRRFTNVVTNQGSDITYADSATLGASFTINTAGVYAISYSDAFTLNSYVGLSLNTTQPTTNVSGIPVGEALIWAWATATASASVSWAGYLPASSVIRAHTLGSLQQTGVNGCLFTITRIA